MIDPLGLAERRLLVIAPHPDDETLGCGGVIHAFARDGRAVRVVFMTDGGASHPGSKSWDRARLSQQRRAEALHALRLLGVDPEAAVFLDLPDADMPQAGSEADQAARERLTLLVQAFQPDLTLMPWRRDPHRDHRDAWRMAREALEVAAPGSATLEYAVWLDELGLPHDQPRATEAQRLSFDIAAAASAKQAAIHAHLSQTTALIEDDPDGFRLSPHTIARLSGPVEHYWRPLG